MHETTRPPTVLRIHPTVAQALRDGVPVVALESSVLAQGLPIPANREADSRTRSIVTHCGAVPAITAVVRGVPSIGLDEADLARFLARDGVVKVSARDLAACVAGGKDGATTVAASLAICSIAGLPVFATGGIGGVHRDAPFDESADLVELARSPVITVCAGAKSILDLPATLERLETLGVTVLGFRTTDFPGFFTSKTGLKVAHSVETAAEIAVIYAAHRALKRPGAILVVQPPPAATALEPELVEQAVATALTDAKRVGVRGAAATPFLLNAVARATDGKSLETNLALLEANAGLAAEIAVAIQVAISSH